MKKTVENVECHFLTQVENEAIFELLGDQCTTVATTVVELYKTQPPNHDIWFRQHLGIMCFVNDANYKRYFFRLYCFNSRTILWEFCVPSDFEYIQSCPFLHQFEGSDCVFGFNFAGDVDSFLFSNRVREQLDTFKTFKKHRNSVKKSEKKQQKIKAKAPRKIDISHPTLFQHIAHCGLDNLPQFQTELGYADNFVKPNCGIVYATIENVNRQISLLSNRSEQEPSINQQQNSAAEYKSYENVKLKDQHSSEQSRHLHMSSENSFKSELNATLSNNHSVSAGNISERGVTNMFK